MEVDSDNLISTHTTQPANYNSVESPETRTNTAKKLPQYVAAITATLSAFAAGTVLGWTAPINEIIEKGDFNNIPVTAGQVGWIGSLPNLGAIFTCLPTGYICDRIGRKNTLLLLIIPYTIGWLSIILGRNVYALLVGRFILGIAAGAGCIAGPMYCSEIAQNEIRGRLGSFFQLMITIGILYAYIFGTFLSPFYYSIACAIIPIVFVACFAWQPKCPLYHLKRGNYEKAKICLQRLRGQQYNIDDELAEIDAVVKMSGANAGFWRSFQQRASKRALTIAMCLMVFQQFSGINAIIFYASDIFKESEININPNYATIIIGACQVVATSFSSMVVDRSGRKLLLLISSYFMSGAILALAIFFTLKIHGELSKEVLSALSFLPVVLLIAYIILFSIGLGPVPWLVISEIFMPEIKGVASSFAVTLNWLWAFIITKTYLVADRAMGQDVTFFIFGFCLLISALTIQAILPETKGKSFTEIQNQLEHY